MEKKDRWAFTSIGTKPPVINMKLVEFMCYQLEEGARTHYPHYQGYIEFKRPYTLIYVKSLFKDKTIHLEMARESREVNILYCLKDDTSKGERFIYNASLECDQIENNNLYP